MKISQVIIFTIIVTSFLTLTGCQEPKGYIELKEPKKELTDKSERKSWLDTPISQQPTNGSQE